ncbi:MAG: hypothetical protein M3Y72_23170 [Acidobacteriota bacterium]|nr:hypothetical protein [Acidobacteriota bacterium]
MAKHRLPDNHDSAGALHAEIPLSRFISPTVFRTKNGSYGMLIAVSGIDPECRLPEDLESYSRRIERALKTLDERFRLYQYVVKRYDPTIPHKITYPSQATADLIHRRLTGFASRSESLANISLYFAILYEGDDTARRLQDWFGASIAASVRRLQDASNRSVDILTTTVRAFTSSLDDIIEFDILDEHRGTGFFRSLLNPDPVHVRHFHNSPGQSLDYVVADTSIALEHDHLRLDDYFLSAATVKLTPSKPRPAAIAAALSQIDCEFIACMEWKPQTSFHMRKLIKSRQKTFVAQGVSMFMATMAGAWTPKSEMPKKHDVEELAENLGDCLVALEQGQQFGSFSCVILLLSKDLQTVRNSFVELVRVYGQADASLVRESLNLWSAYLSVIPGNAQRNHSYSYVLAYDFANLAFAWQSWTGNPFNKHLKDEYLCLYETRDHQLFYFNGHVGGVFGVLKTGAPESGKSFDTVYQVANFQKYDPITVVIDIGAGFRDMTEFFGGQYFEISLRDQRTRMNPFSLENTHGNLQFLFRFIRLLVGRDPNISPEEAAKEDQAIFDGIEAMYSLDPKHRRVKNLSLPKSLDLRLKRWREGGQYGHVFDNDIDTVRFTHLQTFEFQGMEKEVELLVPLCWYITQRLDQVVYDPAQIARPKLLVIDESWRWMLSGDMGPYMVDKLKTGRKNNLCNLFITQSGLDAERAGIGEVLNEACPTKIFFANSEIRPETYERLYQLNSIQAEQITQLKPRQELAIFGTDPARPAVKQFKVVRLRIDNAQDRLLYSNDPEANQMKFRRRAATA